MSAKTGSVLQCRICGKDVYISGKRLKTFRYCSWKCSGISRRGIIPVKAFQLNDKRITGENNHGWKGDEASYVAKHRWVKKWFGKPDHCEICGVDDNIKYNWANLSGLYKRIRQDWKQMCISCHRIYDEHGEKSRKTWYKNHETYPSS